ncbi:MAG: ZIP family metal transporter [Pseudomonadota bacterium]
MTISDALAGFLGMPPAVAASFLAALMASVGIFTVSITRDWAERHRPHFAALASGVLLSTALFLLPEASGGHALAPLAALGGYFLLFVLGRFARRSEGRALAAFIAISLHSTIDGFEYGMLFAAHEATGILGASGLIMHEFVEGVLLFLILRGTGMPKLFAVPLALLGAAATTPVGAIATTLLLPHLDASTFSLLLAFAAGALLFVGASQLPEEFGELSFRSAVFTYALGAFLAVVLLWTTHGPSHGEHHHHGTPQGRHDHGSSR